MKHVMIALLLAVVVRRHTSHNLWLLPAVQAQCEGLTPAQQRHCQPYTGYNTESSELTPPAPIEDGDGDGTDDNDPLDKEDDISANSDGGASNATIIAASVGGAILLAAAYLVRRRVGRSEDDEELEDEHDEGDTTLGGPNHSASAIAAAGATGPVVVKRWLSDLDGEEESPTTLRGNMPTGGPTTADLAAGAYRDDNDDIDTTNDLVDIPFKDDDNHDADMVSSSGSSSSDDDDNDEMEEVMARDRVWVTKMENV